MMMLRGPPMVIAALLIVSATVMVYMRLAISIMQDEPRRRTCVWRVSWRRCKMRSTLLQVYLDAISKHKSIKDTAAFTADRKRIDADERVLTATIVGLQKRARRETTAWRMLLRQNVLVQLRHAHLAIAVVKYVAASLVVPVHSFPFSFFDCEFLNRCEIAGPLEAFSSPFADDRGDLPTHYARIHHLFWKHASSPVGMLCLGSVSGDVVAMEISRLTCRDLLGLAQQV
jgi:hypothetical protein